jgi:hypothetical protein
MEGARDPSDLKRTGTRNWHQTPVTNRKEAPSGSVTGNGATISKVWAWVELNYRPHAYQGGKDKGLHPAGYRQHWESFAFVWVRWSEYRMRQALTNTAIDTINFLKGTNLLSDSNFSR